MKHNIKATDLLHHLFHNILILGYDASRGSASVGGYQESGYTSGSSAVTGSYDASRYGSYDASRSGSYDSRSGSYDASRSRYDASRTGVAGTSGQSGSQFSYSGSVVSPLNSFFILFMLSSFGY